MPKTNDAALHAFIAAKTEIDAMLARLASFSADHFDYSPEDVNWGHVGTLNHYQARLCAFHERWASIPWHRGQPFHAKMGG